MSCVPRVRRILTPLDAVPQWQVNMLCDRCVRPMGFIYTGTREQLAENTAISTVGYTFGHGRAQFGLAAITGASYSAAVWWDKHDRHPCGVEGCGKRYVNDGQHFSRACHMCGGVVAVDYRLPHGFGLRAEYYGLRHMTPTFQGVVVQATYTIGAR